MKRALLCGFLLIAALPAGCATFQETGNGLKQTGTAIKEDFKKAGPAMKEDFQKIGPAMKEGFSEMGRDMKSAAGEAKDSLKETFQ